MVKITGIKILFKLHIYLCLFSVIPLHTVLELFQTHILFSIFVYIIQVKNQKSKNNNFA